MKRCPECRRDYFDDSLLYCLDDGSALLEGPASADEPATAILSDPEAGTRMYRGVQAQDISGAQLSEQSHTARIAPGHVSARSKIIISAIAIAILVAGVFGYRYFAPANGRQINSIAVMPFVNESGNPDADYLSDGMTETLINSLSQVPNLSVKARSTVFRYKSKDYDPRTIAKELSVEALLSGHMVQRGDMLTLSIELVDGQTENVQWGKRYERKLSDLVLLQSDVAHDVSSRLKPRLSSADEAKVTKSYTTDPKAFELYLKGRYLSRQFTLEGYERGVEAFNQAIVIDPNYALAYAGLSDAYFYVSTIHLPPTEALPKVGEYAEKALAIDDSLAAAHHSIANYRANYERDNPGAKREFDRALELDPADTSIYYDYSQLLANIGETTKAVDLARRAKQIDPQDASLSSTLAQALILSGMYDEGLQEADTSVKLDNKNWWCHYWRAVALSEKGMHDEAIAAAQTAAELDESPLIRGILSVALARAGRRSEAQQVVDDLIATSKTKFVSQTSIAMGYVGLGERDKAFEWLHRALESHDEQIVWIYKHPMFAPLRNGPEYQHLLSELHLAP